MIRSILLLSLLAVTLPGRLGLMPCAAQAIPLSENDLFKLIDENSRTLDLKSLCLEEAREGANAARSQRLPVLDASLSVGYLGNGYLTDRNFSHGTDVRNPHSNNNFALEAMQVIYGGGAISNGVRMAELNLRMAGLDLEESRQEVRFIMLGWLIDLQCFHNRLRVLDDNISLARQVLSSMQARRDEGAALLSDITRYELQLENLLLQREKTDEAVRTTDYRLANALGFRASDTHFRPMLSTTDYRSIPDTEACWQVKALESNLLLRKIGMGIEMKDTERKIIAAERRPTVSLFAYGRFDSPIVIEVPVLDKNFMYWGFGVNVSFRISSLYTAGRRLRGARIAVSESRKAYDIGVERLQDDVQAAYESYRTAVTELRTQEKSLELAIQNYDMVRDRFDNGMALITDMLDAANVRLSSEMGLENARTLLLFSYYRLKYVANTL